MVMIKICGLTNLDDALNAARAGADLLGFILHPKSPRYVTPWEIATIVAGVKRALAIDKPPENATLRALRFVGVFVNTPCEQIVQVLAETNLDYAQLHGDETPDVLTRLEGRAYKAIRPKTLAEALRMADVYAPFGVAHGPALLMEGYHPAAYGGVGQQADWETAAQVARRAPGLLLAGGLSAQNVAEAVAAVHPWGVDVSSGVEAAPGKKDHKEVRRFIANSRLAQSTAPDFPTVSLPMLH